MSNAPLPQLILGPYSFYTIRAGVKEVIAGQPLRPRRVSQTSTSRRELLPLGARKWTIQFAIQSPQDLINLGSMWDGAVYPMTLPDGQQANVTLNPGAVPMNYYPFPLSIVVEEVLP